MEYIVKTTDVINPSMDSSEWEKANTGFVKSEPWQGHFPAPDTWFKLLRGKEGLSVLIHTDERDLRSEVLEENGEVCEDSCMEFFLKPNLFDVNYVNFEINPKGVMMLGLGKDRHDRLLLDEPRSVFSIETRPNEGDWTVKYYIPDSFLLKYFSELTPVCRGNFFKCGESTNHSHFATWSPILTDRFDFHIPDFFGMLKIEE